MKKYILIFLVGFLFLIPGVKAETINFTVYNHFLTVKELYNDEIDYLVNLSLEKYNQEYKTDYPYYFIQIHYSLDEDNKIIDSSHYLGVTLYFTSEIPSMYDSSSILGGFGISLKGNYGRLISSRRLDGKSLIYRTPKVELKGNSSFGSPSAFTSTSLTLFYYNAYYFSNFDLLNLSGYNFIIDNNLTINQNDIIPSYTSSSYNNKYTTVNLDDYHYVILSLKDYNQEKAFSTNLQVKGMVGITPVYNYGTSEKETITDRCNLSYQDYTDYRMYILENDLKNNSVYFVKSCENNSSFKFDNTIFDITYVTDENKADPVVTINGKDYHTIPFDNLSNSANKNEENNFVPGENKPFDPLGSVADYISGFWSALTTFMGLVTKFFNTLPVEIRAISITSFVTGATLGLIKILKS